MDYTEKEQKPFFLIEGQAKQISDAVVERLVSYRKQCGITQQDIANATGIKRANIARLESRKHAITLEYLVKYAGCLDLEICIGLKEKSRKKDREQSKA